MFYRFVVQFQEFSVRIKCIRNEILAVIVPKFELLLNTARQWLNSGFSREVQIDGNLYSTDG